MIRDIQQLYHIRQTNPQQALTTACKEFESLFVHQLLKTMGESMTDGFFGSGLASDFYKDMLFQSIADSVAQRGSLGIKDVLERSMQHSSSDKG